MKEENVNLTDRQAEFVRQSIAAGDYQDASEVIRAGIHLLQEWQAERLKQEAALRAILKEAKDGGTSGRTPEHVWSAVEKRYHTEHA